MRLSAAKFIRAQIKDAISNGATDIINKVNFKIDEESNCYVSPSVLINVNHSMNFMMNETFGPSVGIMKVSNENEYVKVETHGNTFLAKVGKMDDEKNDCW